MSGTSTCRSKAGYSLVQFCPDPARAEAVNVGVLLLCQDKQFVDVKMSPNSKRPVKLFGRGSFDADLLSIAKQSIAERVRIERDCLLSLEGLQELIDSRGNDIQITKPRAIKVRNPGVDLDRLFCELVEPIGEQESAVTQLIPRLDDELRSPRFFGRVTFNEQVHIPVQRKNISVRLPKRLQPLVAGLPAIVYNSRWCRYLRSTPTAVCPCQCNKTRYID